MTPPPPGARAVTAGGHPCRVESRPFAAVAGERVIIRYWDGDHYGPRRSVGAAKVYFERSEDDVSSETLPAIPAPSRYRPSDLQLMAQEVAKSRLFGLDAAQAFTLMLLAESKGLHPIQAVERYHVINGRPTMKADAMHAEFQKAGGTVEWVQRTDDAHEAIFRHPTHAPKGVNYRFTMRDAERAELLKNPTWKRYPANMLRARVISNGVRLVMPGVVSGIYTPEEAEDMPPRAVEAPAPEPWAGSESPDPEHQRARLEALADVAKPFGVFLTDKTAEARAAFHDACDAAGLPRPDDGLLPSVHQVNRHLLKWCVAEGWLPDPGKVDQRECVRQLSAAWEKADRRARGLMRLNAIGYLHQLYKLLLDRLANQEHGDAWEPPADDETKEMAADAADRN